MFYIYSNTPVGEHYQYRIGVIIAGRKYNDAIGCGFASSIG